MVPLTETVKVPGSGTEFGSSGSENLRVRIAPLIRDALTVGAVVSGPRGVSFVTNSQNQATSLPAESWMGVASGPVGGV